MSGKFFLDTNILVYSFDTQTPQKKRRSQELIEQALLTHEGVVSTQVVQEFLNVATGKFAKPLTLADAQQYLHDVLAPLCKVFPSIDLFRQALDLQKEFRFSFYDSLVVSGALQSGCEVLYSEDLQDGQQIRGLRIVNPFED